MLNIDQLLSDFTNRRILIVGDVMIDRYLEGTVNRISPEAPVPVVHLQNQDDRLGGAANVALNAKALGAQVFLYSVIGADQDGEQLLQLLPEQALSTTGLLQSTERRTTVKARVMSNAQQLIRIDQEETSPLSTNDAQRLTEAIEQLLELETIDVILFQDYNKGVLTFKVIREITLMAIKRDIPIVVDPKYDHFLAYKKATLFKPNLKEVAQNLPFPVTAQLEDLQKAANYIRQQIGNTLTLITLSEKGVFYQTEDESQIVPTQARQIADVCGAGDTVVAISALGLAAKLPPAEIALLANLAGGQVCEKVGVVPIDPQQLREEYLQLLTQTPPAEME
ncbi:MAG: bifunctional ADP-heptose synthase [Bacteroidota bacterium]